MALHIRRQHREYTTQRVGVQKRRRRGRKGGGGEGGGCRHAELRCPDSGLSVEVLGDVGGGGAKEDEAVSSGAVLEPVMQFLRVFIANS